MLKLPADAFAFIPFMIQTIHILVIKLVSYVQYVFKSQVELIFSLYFVALQVES